MTDVNEIAVYKNGADIEIPIFNIDHRGNPVFDFKTSREIFVCPLVRTKGLTEIDYCESSMAVNKVDVRNVCEYELDDSGDYIYDEVTKKKKVSKNPDGTDRIYKLMIPPFYVRKLKLPQERWLAEQLVFNTRNASVEMLENQSTLSFAKSFFIFDPLYEQNRIKQERSLINKAYAHAKELSGINELQITHLVLFKSSANYEYLSDVALQQEIDTYAKNNPQNYIDLVVDNKDFDTQGLLQLCLRQKLITITPNGEWLMVNEAGHRPIPLGLNELSTIIFLRENPQYRSILISKSGFDNYLRETEMKKTENSTVENIRENHTQLEAQVQELLMREKILTEQLAKFEAVAQVKSVKINIPTPKNVRIASSKKPKKEQKLELEPQLI